MINVNVHCATASTSFIVHGPFDIYIGLLLAPLSTATPAALPACRRRRRNCPRDELSTAALRTACCDDDVLPVVNHVRHWQPGLRTGRQWRLPYLLPGFLVICMEDSHTAGAFTGEQKVLRDEQTCLRWAAGRRHVR